MITLIVCIKRKSGLDRQEFGHYWRDVHAPLINRCPEFLRHVRRYTQYHLVDGASPTTGIFGVESAYDGVAELTFDTKEAMAAAFSEPRYLERVRPDEPNFVDLDGCLSFITEANVVRDDLATTRSG